MKKTLWLVLEKYDGLVEYKEFCDSLSRFIQGKENSKDLLCVYVGLSKIEKSDKIEIDSVLGSRIDSFLFSI
jgi:hypothetical protein